MAGPADRFLQSIVWADLTGRDAFGKPTMGDQATSAARVQPMRRLIRDPNGRESLTSHVVYTAADITLRSRVWFPGTDSGDFAASRTPLGIDDYCDGDGVVRFRKIWFG